MYSLGEHKGSRECGEIFSQIAGTAMNKKTLPGVKVFERQVCEESLTGDSSLIVLFMCILYTSLINMSYVVGAL